MRVRSLYGIFAVMAVLASVVGCAPDAERAITSPWPSAERERAGASATRAPEPDVQPPKRKSAPGEGVACESRDNTLRSWYFQPAGSGETPGIPADVSEIADRTGALWRIPTDEKVVYLTFDQGYEAGYTARILDTLREKRVTATFFLTGAYIREEPDLVRRIAEEGHLVGNHTDSHPSLPGIAEQPGVLAEEYREVERVYERLTGSELAPFERPPRGEYSERTLCMVSELGYTSVMWSFAYRDWLTDDQPPVDVAYQRIVDGSHPGAILLLHSVSSSNTEALPRVIDELRGRGYRFGSLDEVRTGEVH